MYYQTYFLSHLSDIYNKYFQLKMSMVLKFMCTKWAVSDDYCCKNNSKLQWIYKGYKIQNDMQNYMAEYLNFKSEDTCVMKLKKFMNILQSEFYSE